ncbi:MAG: acyl--CoA ligase [Lachnospiraceae bacterium]|nr:acyl--CoA ligase [Lachnospiraceae bacterium]MBR1910320.1 acyl--CoA ligase [Lachnospiraceae bacterium]
MNAPLPKATLYEYLWENNKDYLHGTALKYFGKCITYGTLFEKSKKAANAFLNMGIKQGDIVTIMSMQTPETIYTIYGLNYIGAVSNLVYMTLTENEILDTIETTASKALFVMEPVLDKVEKVCDKITVPVVVLPVSGTMPFYMRALYNLKNGRQSKNAWMPFKDFLSKVSSDVVPVQFKEHDSMAVIVYTSGTTGEPKGVCLSNDGINALVYQDMNGLVEFERGKECLFLLPPFVGFGITNLHMILCGGVTLILQIVHEPEAIVTAFFRTKPYCFLTGPVLMDEISAHEPGKLQNVRYFIGGGGSITSAQEERINTLLKKSGSSARYSNGYGMTEAGSVLCYNINEVYKAGSVGIPFLKTTVKVVDDDGNELPYGKTGELLFDGDSLMMGYFDNTSATEEVIVYDEKGKRWLKTGDLGYVDEDGFVFLEGRKKRIYITMLEDGYVYKLFPQRIEELISALNGINACGVVVRKDEKRINEPVLFASIENYEESNVEAKTEEIKQAAGDGLPRHMRPVEIKIIKKMPMTASGKIDYR